MQTTIKHPVRFTGVGLHSGKAVDMLVRPAQAGTGVVFYRKDLGQTAVPATWDRVQISPLNTRIVGDNGASVSTIEHLMAALAGLGIHNVAVDIDGPEVPILDGSAAPFVHALHAAGVRRLDAALRLIKVLAPVEVEMGLSRARLSPAEGFEISFDIDFADAAIGRQHRALDLANGAFVRELSDSRTFCRNADVIEMRKSGLALGGTLENAVVVEGDRVLTPGGLRHDDEPVRHKMLDALGDLFTAGAPILGRYEGKRAGHAMTNLLLRKLFSTEGAWCAVECDAVLAARLPGVGVRWQDLPAVA